MRNKIDSLVSRTGIARPYGSITDLYRGYDHRSSGSPFIRDTTHQGYTFFSRPLINLSRENIYMHDDLSKLLDTNPQSPYAYIRAVLDPLGRYPHDLFDHRQAFIPPLTNMLISHSGWPDRAIDTYTSPAGVMKESWGMVDGTYEDNEPRDITATFYNHEGNIIGELIDSWVVYSGSVYIGDCYPYPAAIRHNFIDYQTRQWRILLDKNMKIVKGIASFVAGSPTVSPVAARFNYNRETPYLTDSDRIDVQFRSYGVEYNSPILYEEFNSTVAWFNPSLLTNPGQWTKVEDDEINYFNWANLYPWIDTETKEFMWFVDNFERNRVLVEHDLV